MAAAQHHQAAATNHVPEALATALGLTKEQTKKIDQLASEACAAMMKYHEQILAVLTPEQQAKMKELHGGK